MKSQINIQIIAHGVTRLELPARTLPPFTHTNSYIVASKNEAILIDPGFYEAASLELVSKTLEGTQFKAIVLTHTHPDHIEGIALVRSIYPNVPIYVHELEQEKVQHHGHVQALNAQTAFFVGSLELQAIFTPGHSSGHLSFYLANEKLALVGDMVAGFGSIWIGTPDGNITDYFRSLVALGNLELVALAPGHGDVIHEPYKKLAEVKAHRLQRLEQVCNALTNKSLTLDELRQMIYPEIDARIETLAERSLLALLEKLGQDNLVVNRNEQWMLVNNP